MVQWRAHEHVRWIRKRREQGLQGLSEVRRLESQLIRCRNAVIFLLYLGLLHGSMETEGAGIAGTLRGQKLGVARMQAGHNEAEAGNMTKKIRGAIGHRRHIDGAIEARRDKATQ